MPYSCTRKRLTRNTRVNSPILAKANVSFPCWHYTRQPYGKAIATAVLTEAATKLILGQNEKSGLPLRSRLILRGKRFLVVDMEMAQYQAVL